MSQHRFQSVLMNTCSRLSAIFVFIITLLASLNTAAAQCFDWSTSFNAASNGTNGTVYAMCVFDEDGEGGNPPSLFVAGHFTMAGSVAANNIARWNGTTWSAVGAGITGGSATVLSLAVGNTGGGKALYVGGSFTTAGAGGANNIARWNGASWSALGSGTSGNGGWVRAIVQCNSGSTKYIYAGGDFTSAGGITLNYIARWNGSAWSALGTTIGTSGGVFALAVMGSELVVGGAFPTAGLLDPNTQFIAKWNGTAWSSFGTGMNSTVNALLVDGGVLYAGGFFTAASGTPANHIAKWTGGWSPLGAGTNSRVRALAAFDDECGHGIYAGGDFSTAGGLSTFGIVRWSATASTWKAITSGVVGTVYAFKPYFTSNKSTLYVAGGFSWAGSVLASNISAWVSRDLDEDGIFDCWETEGQGIDIDCDGTYDLDLYALGARKDHKDVFVEFDAMTGLIPLPGPINRVSDAFDASPVTNPDGVTGVKLHVQAGELGVPLETWVALPGEWPPAYDTFKTSHFGTPTEHGNPKVIAAKRLVFRYCVFGYNCQMDKTSGMGEIGGNDFMVTLGRWRTSGGTDDQQAGTFMHELGHTLGLYHGGNQIDPQHDERFNNKPNYRSVMNYIWQTPKPWMTAGSWPLAAGGRGYSMGGLNAVNEAALYEADSIGGVYAYMVPVGPPPIVSVHESGPVNWDRDAAGAINPSALSLDVNQLDPAIHTAFLDNLTDNADWLSLKYNFRDSGSFSDGAHDEITDVELTEEVDDMISAMPLPPCPADIAPPGGNRFVNVDDLLAVISAWGAAGGAADVNHNGFVNVDDLLAVISAWGPCP